METWRKSAMSRVPGNDGFSLVEIMMVMLILTVGILPLAVIQHSAKRDVTESARYTDVLTVAHSQMERIKGLGFNTAASDSGTVGRVTWNATVSNVSIGLDRIVVTASVDDGGAGQSITIADLLSLR